jgi:hypothetical protein
MEDFEFIKGYENLYKINRNGDVYSCWYKKIIKSQETEDGYLFVKLSNENGCKKKRIHRLLGLQYLENPDNLPEIDHIDRDKKNNSINNLRWVSRVDNRNNRDDIIENLSEDKKKEREDKIRERAKLWAEKNRREKGCKIKAEMSKSKTKEYFSERARNKRANETPEQKELRLQKRREQYKLKQNKYI